MKNALRLSKVGSDTWVVTVTSGWTNAAAEQTHAHTHPHARTHTHTLVSHTSCLCVTSWLPVSEDTLFPRPPNPITHSLIFCLTDDHLVWFPTEKKGGSTPPVHHSRCQWATGSISSFQAPYWASGMLLTGGHMLCLCYKWHAAAHFWAASILPSILSTHLCEMYAHWVQQPWNQGVHFGILQCVHILPEI